MERNCGESGSKAENVLRLTLFEREVRTRRVAVVSWAEELGGFGKYVLKYCYNQKINGEVFCKRDHHLSFYGRVSLAYHDFFASRSLASSINLATNDSN